MSRPRRDYVQVSAWIPREHLPILRAIGGPSEIVRDGIYRKGGSEAKLLEERAETQRLREELEERERLIDIALELLRKQKEELQQEQQQNGSREKRNAEHNTKNNNSGNGNRKPGEGKK